MPFEFTDFTDIVKHFDWNNPLIFVAVIMIILLFKGKWKALIMISAIFLLAWQTGDYIIKNIISSEILITVPHLIYIGGGIVVALTAVIAFTKFIIE